MIEIIKGFTEQVTEYSTILGQIWYLCVFLFRGMVVMTVGGDVYSDEQSEFRCSTMEVGCENLCFSKFSKISHIRFWAFQLLAVTTPTILFHFFAIGVKTKIEKMRSRCKERNAEVQPYWEPIETVTKSNKEAKKMKRKPTRVRFKSVYDPTSNNLKDVAFTDSIYAAYYVNVIGRAVIEGLFLYLSYNLFKFMDHSRETDNFGPLEFLWFSVPPLYRCQGADISAACHQHTAFGGGGYVPCWISRPWEKTIFLRYMNILSSMCFVLSVLEFIYLSLRGTRTANRRRLKRRKSATAWVPMSGGTTSTLAVPIKLSNVAKYEKGSVSDIVVDMLGSDED